MASGGRVPKAAGPAEPTGDSYPANTSPADPEFVVGVIDTGLIRQGGRVHEWLAGHVNDQDDNDDELPELPPAGANGGEGTPKLPPLGVNDGHGTFISGLILREAPRATIRMIRALDDDTDRQTVDDLIAGAITDLVNHRGVKVINLSFGGQIWERRPPEAIRAALESAGGTGIVVTAPAGNVPSGTKVWPAAFADEFDHVISVGAVDETPIYLQADGPPPLASFSNYGSWVKAFANGVDVLGPFCNYQDGDLTFTNWARWSGTSFATATVAGVIARVAMDNGTSALQAASSNVLSAATRLADERARPETAAYVPGIASNWSLARSGTNTLVGNG